MAPLKECKGRSDAQLKRPVMNGTSQSLPTANHCHEGADKPGHPPVAPAIYRDMIRRAPVEVSTSNSARVVESIISTFEDVAPKPIS